MGGRPPLKEILSNLREVVNDARSRTDHQTVVKEFEEGLKEFDSVYVVPENDRNPDGVMKVLAVAVHETVQQKVDLKKVDPKDMENHDTKRLAKLLGVDSLDKCFLENSDVDIEETFKSAKSPLDMADCLQPDVTPTVVKNIIENQFQIKWNTKTVPNESSDSTDQSTDTTEELPDTTEESPDTTRESHDTTEESTDTTGESPDTTEESTDTTEESPDTTEESTDTTEESPNTTEESTDTTEESSDTTEESSDTTEESPDITEESPDTTEESPDITEESTDTTGESPDTTEESTDTTEESPDTAEESTDTTEESPNATEESTDTTEESTDTTNESLDTPDTEESANTTDTGPPTNYTFYQFCDTERTMRLFKYMPRLAHVKTTLYKKSRKEGISNLQRIAENKKKLCPKVYIKTAQGWKTWDANNDSDLQDSNLDQLEWIQTSMKSLINENSDELGDDSGSLQKYLERPTLYWAVLEDRDFITGEKLKLKDIGKTQGYIGKANNGIRGRWIAEINSHCSMMKECLDNVCAMTTYDPSRLKRIHLADARLALAKVRGEGTALFVMKTFSDEVEKAEPGLRASLFEALDLLKSLPSNEDQPDLAPLNEAHKVLKKAESIFKRVVVSKARVTDVQKDFKKVEPGLKRLKEECLDCIAPSVLKFQQDLNEWQKALEKDKKQLEQAEKKHLEGLSYASQTFHGKKKWVAKDPRYGMNNK